MKVTFRQAVVVTGAPRLKLKMDTNYEDQGERWANYAGNDRTPMLTFAYTVVEQDSATRGVAVLRGALDLNGGAIPSASAPLKDAHLWHAGLDHDHNHRVTV